MPTVDGLPYPNSSATPDVPGDILLLVNALARKTGGGIAYAANASALAQLVTDGLVKEGSLALQLDTKQIWYRETSSWTDSRLIDDTGWVTPGLLNSWTSVGGFPIQYRRLRGVVYLRGHATGGTTNPAFNLPAGFRPSTDAWMTVPANTTATTVSRVIVRAAGTVDLTSGQTPFLEGTAPFIAEA